MFANSASRGQIYVKILPQGEPVQLTRDPSTQEQPVFSPDGARIIYTSLATGVQSGIPGRFQCSAALLNRFCPMHRAWSGLTISDSCIRRSCPASTWASPRRRKAAPSPGRSTGHDKKAAWRTALPAPLIGKSLLVVEMNGGEWLPCRLVPFDGSSAGHAIGPPDGQCTTAAWSPDGRWMYLSSNSGGGFHIWRQKYPDGVPERITSGPTEQEGTAVTPDSQVLITSMGLQQASIWLQEQTAVRQLTSEGFAMLPTMLPVG